VSTLIEHARHELGLIMEDDKITEAIVQVIQVFVDGGLAEDGTAAAMATSHIGNLLRRRPLSPLTNDPAEWAERDNGRGFVIWQSTRNPEAFSDDEGKTYWVLSDPRPPIVDKQTIYTSLDKTSMMRPANIRETAEKMSEQREEDE
jgi:hypothetical protein